MDDTVTPDWVARFCETIFGTARQLKMQQMVTGAVDGYLARMNQREADAPMKVLYESAIYFCSDNKLGDRPNNEETRCEILEHLVLTFAGRVRRHA